MTSKNIKKLLNNKDILKRFKENNIKHLYLAGSYSRGEENKSSDIDLIYEFGKGGCLSGFGFINMKLYLEEYFQKEIDLVERQFINKNLVKYLEEDKVVIF